MGATPADPVAGEHVRGRKPAYGARNNAGGMARNNPSQMVRQVPGNTPTSTARSATRPARAPTLEQIRLRAFQIYESRGCVHGHDIEDWTQAERELRRNV